MLRPPHQIRLDDLLDGSPGSQLISYRFESKELHFQLFHGGLNALLLFTVPTDTVHGRSVTTDPRRSACRLDLIDLEANLSIKGGRYSMPAAESTFLEHARDRLTLAYGRRASESRHLLLIRGDYPLLACLVRDPADIHWTVD